MPRRRCSHGQAPRSEAPRPTRTQRGQLSEISWSPPQISLVWQLMKYELKWVEQEEDGEKDRPDGRGGDGCCSLGGPAPGGKPAALCCLRARRSNSKLDCSLAPPESLSNSNSNSEQEQDVSCSAGTRPLGSAYPCASAVHMEPFSSSAFKVLI